MIFDSQGRGNVSDAKLEDQVRVLNGKNLRIENANLLLSYQLVLKKLILV